MPVDELLMRERLTKLWRDEQSGTVPELALADGPYAVISDLHLGDGGDADDFRENVRALQQALLYYKERGYQLILLGDVEELWQFDLQQIITRYDEPVYKYIRAFGDENVFRVFGNHDLDWSLSDPICNRSQRPLAYEGIKIVDENGDPLIFLVHGHQGSIDSDRFSGISRFLVRRVWTLLEPAARDRGWWRNPSEPNSPIPNNYERLFFRWARENGVLLICGHSHRAIFASQSFYERLKAELEQFQRQLESPQNEERDGLWKKGLKAQIEKLEAQIEEEEDRGRDVMVAEAGESLPCYFNSGCGLYGSGITAIEIGKGGGKSDGDEGEEELEIRLVKWSNEYVLEQDDRARQVYERAPLNELVAAVKTAVTLADDSFLSDSVATA